MRLALLKTRFHPDVVDGLERGARSALRKMGARAPTVIEVPGAFELPLAAQGAASSGRFDALVALGAVIRGQTDHYEHIARVATSGLARVALDTGVPVGLGVLTVATEKQARARSGAGGANKGSEAARAAVALARTLWKLGFPRPSPRRPRRG